MPASIVQLYKDNRSPSITDVIETDAGAVDLTGSSVRLKMRAVNSQTLKVDAAAVIVTPAAGSIRYDWQSADVDTSGLYAAWFSVTFPSGTVQDQPEFYVRILEHSVASTHLTTLAAVRQFTGKRFDETGQDELILDLIERGSRAVENYCNREFHNVGTATRTVAFKGAYVDLSPYDLRSVTAIQIDPETDSPTTLASSDYVLLPIGAPKGTYTGIQLSRTVVPSSTSLDYFGFNQLEVAGTWGFATVPADVELAVLKAVAEWVRSESYMNPQIDQEQTGFNGLPAESRALLLPYKRMTYGIL